MMVMKAFHLCIWHEYQPNTMYLNRKLTKAEMQDLGMMLVLMEMKGKNTQNELFLVISRT